MRRSKTGSAEQARGNFTPPPRAAVPPANVAGTPRAVNTPGRLSPRNWRVRTRLNAILLIPVLVGLVMGGFQVKGSVDTWREAQDAESTALVVRAAAEYGQALLNERDLTAQSLLTGERDAPVVGKSRAATDAAKAKFDIAVKSMPAKQGLRRRLSLFRGVEPQLAALRQSAYTAALETPDKTGGHGGPVATQEGYTLVQHSLMEFSNELGLGTSNITSYGRTVYAIQLAKAAASLQRSIGLELLVRPSQKREIRSGQIVAFSSYAYLEDVSVGEYASGGTEADTKRLQDVMKRQAVRGAEELAAAKQQATAAGRDFTPPPSQEGSVYDGMVAAIATGDSPEQLAKRGVTPEVWMAAATGKFDGYAVIEKGLVDRAVTDAAQISADAKAKGLTNGGIVVVALLAAFVLAGMMARQMSRSMRSLRTAAFGVAEQRLPMLVDQLSRAEPGQVDTRVEPIPIHTRDEIGEVARAFDQVHREAVRLAAEQAMLRGNVNAIFTNLSRRNQSLIEGQLTLITELESNEGEPEQLESLFRLDHLATRMRRNGENLLVLAGEEPGRRWNQPVPLVDVLRAASSEVESYARIELTGVPETDIHGDSVTDLVHLLAELLENATTFSSPQTKVRVTATRLPDGRVMIEIHDKGIGLTAEDFADINNKLANPPVVDATVSQRMGLFVVGRLADRHGIRVQLRPSGEQAGTTSLVMLPDLITHGGGGEEPGTSADEFSVSQIIPDPSPPPEVQGHHSPATLTAADLGFDDSRYDRPEPDSLQLNPVNRTLLREERRAALEAKPGAGEPLFSDQVDGRYRPEAGGTHTPPQVPYGQNPPLELGSGSSYAQQGGYEEYQAPDGYQQPGAYRQPDAYQQPETYQQPGAYQQPQAYTESGYQAQQSTETPYENPFDTQPRQGEWADQTAYQSGQQPEGRTESDSARPAAENAGDRVGFHRQGPSPSTSHALTDAGLPRRDGGRSPEQERESTGQDDGRSGQDNGPAGQTPRPGQTEAEGTEDWRSANDDRRQRAEKLREPKAGGVTASGLPRRVPKANLVEGRAEQTPQVGPQVSRAPEDVRGRLSNLRRGVQRGRNAGADKNGPGSGPGSTYNQER
ncbi:nitrate- and nitrite sensing domain-containing protein [Streptomyces sp. NPDC088725]|uniref:sensor histidine kinase n=1 Tax=Streptomyces sp. NPDC088725 TaxID=3365873 RepID=UPI003802D467